MKRRADVRKFKRIEARADRLQAEQQARLKVEAEAQLLADEILKQAEEEGVFASKLKRVFRRGSSPTGGSGSTTACR